MDLFFFDIDIDLRCGVDRRSVKQKWPGNQGELANENSDQEALS